MGEFNLLGFLWHTVGNVILHAVIYPTVKDLCCYVFVSSVILVIRETSALKVFCIYESCRLFMMYV